MNMEQNKKTDSFNRNDKQLFFNQIKGAIHEITMDGDWCSITLNVGHESPRFVNLSMKKVEYDKVKENHLIGDKVLIRFYLTSRFKNERWYTVANVLQIDAIVYPL
jgi:hypothetical protein